MFTNVQYRSLSRAKDNIDVCNVQENCAWVIDGANGLFPAHVSDCASDADWFVRELNLFLKKNLQTPFQSIADNLRVGLQAIHEEFQKFPGASSLYDLHMPSACCAIVRMRREKISFFIMGNCEIMITYHNGDVKTLCDLRLQELDAKLLEVSQDARKKQRMPLFRARNFMDHMLVENRLRRNVEDGFYVLGEDSDVVNHALVGELPMLDIKSIALVCNGFSQYYNCKKVTQSLDDYLSKTRNEDLVMLYEDLLSRKQRNEKLARFMQEKLSGQSTIVYFDVEDTNLIASKA